MVLSCKEVAVLKKVVGIAAILIAIALVIIIAIVIVKKGTYRGDIFGLLIDSFEFVVLIIALILLGLVLIKT